MSRRSRGIKNSKKRKAIRKKLADHRKSIIDMLPEEQRQDLFALRKSEYKMGLQ